MALLAALVAIGLVIVFGPQKLWLLVVIILGALAFGVLFVLPIGGADMPVVISLLNAFTGVAAAATGFVLHQNVLIVSGMLVGASGTLLTLMMARAMGRKVSNVFFGAFGQLQTAEEGGVSAEGGTVRSATAEDVGRPARLRRPRDHRPRLRARGRAGPARRARARRRAREARRRRQVRDPPGRRPHARAHERPPRRGERALRPARRDGRDQPGVRAHRRRARDRRERRHEPRRPLEPRQPDLRDADPERRQGAERGRAQALDAPRLRRASTTRSTRLPNTQMLFGDARESVVKLVAAVKAL